MAVATQEPSTEPRTLWGARRLARAVSAQSASTLANAITALVVPWIVLERTGSALSAGTLAFATGLAAVLGTLVGGIVVDRLGGRLTSMLSDLLSLATVLVIPAALALDRLPLWLIIISQVAGVLFDGPGVIARDTLVPTAARADGVPLLRATSLLETLQGTAGLVGPLLAGVLVAGFGASSALLVAAGLFGAAIIVIRGLDRQQVRRDTALTARQAVRDLREGFAFLLREPLLGPLNVLMTVWVAVFAPVTTIVYPAWFVFSGTGAAALGLFLGAGALGGILGGFVFAAVGGRFSGFRWFVATNLASTALLATLLLVQPGSVASVVLSFAMGFLGAGSLPLLNTAFFRRTPEELLGRVNGAGWSMVLAALPFSALLMGVLVNATSPLVGLAVVAGCNLCMVAAFWLLPAARLIDSDPEPQPSAV